MANIRQASNQRPSVIVGQRNPAASNVTVALSPDELEHLLCALEWVWESGSYYGNQAPFDARTGELQIKLSQAYNQANQAG